MSILQRVRLVLTLSCRDASRLLSDRTERPLARHERLALRLHLLICRGCRRFRSYLRLLESALKGEEGAAAIPPNLSSAVESDAVLTDDARERLKRRLEQA